MMLGGCSSPPSAGISASKPDPVARSGGEIFTSCLLCHSTREMQRGPIIDGLPAWSVELQLRKFRDGIRGGNPTNKSEVLMAAGESIVKGDEEIRRVAAHIAGLPPQSHLLTVRGDKNRGKLIYLQCANCHGIKGEGKAESKSPPLNTLEDWFQLDQLRKFKAGLRGKHPQDAEGNAMRLAVLGLSDDDLKHVTRYIAEDLAVAKPLPKPEPEMRK
ncbi:MAG: cytochrome-c oxidase [Verrucomicrobia bacterium]|nr:cytochrome-c oxidase [Verrucomicrobiota bacterium]